MASFSGVLNNLYHNTDLNGLALDGLILWDDLAPGDGIVIDNIADFDEIADFDGGLFDSLGNIESMSGVQPYGYYDFDTTTDLEAIYEAHIQRRLRLVFFNTTIDFDDHIGSIDDWGDVDGTTSSNVNAQILVRSTDDDPNDSPTWSDWRPIINSFVRGRAFQYRAELTSDEINENAAMVEIGAIVTLPQRMEAAGNLTTGATTLTVLFDNAFKQSSISITPQNMQTGDYFTLGGMFDDYEGLIDSWTGNIDSLTTDANRSSGFSITFYNSASTIIDRTFDYLAVGFGKQL